MASKGTPATNLKRKDRMTNDHVGESSSGMTKIPSSASLSSLEESDGPTGAALPDLEICSPGTTALIPTKGTENAKTILPPTPPKTTSPKVIKADQLSSEHDASTTAKAVTGSRPSGTLRGDVPEFVPRQPAAPIGGQQYESMQDSPVPLDHSLPSEHSLDPDRAIHSYFSPPPRQPAQPRCTNRFGLAPEQEWLARFHEKRERKQMGEMRFETEDALLQPRETIGNVGEEMVRLVLADADEATPRPLGVEAWLLATLSPTQIREATLHIGYALAALTQSPIQVQRPRWLCEPVSLDERFRIFRYAAYSCFPEVVEPFPGYMTSSTEAESESDDQKQEAMFDLLSSSGEDDADDDNTSIISNPWEGMKPNNTRCVMEAANKKHTGNQETDPIKPESPSMAQRSLETKATQDQVPDFLRDFLRERAARAVETSQSGQPGQLESGTHHLATTVPARQTPTAALPPGPSTSNSTQQQPRPSHGLQPGRRPMGAFQAGARDSKAPYGSVQVLQRPQQQQKQPSAALAHSPQQVPQRAAPPTGSSMTRLPPTRPKTDRMRNINWRRGD